MEPNNDDIMREETYEVVDDSSEDADEVARFEDEEDSGISAPLVVGGATVVLVGTIVLYEKAVKPAAKFVWGKATNLISGIIAKKKGYVDGEYKDIPPQEEEIKKEEEPEKEESK